MRAAALKALGAALGTFRRPSDMGNPGPPAPAALARPVPERGGWRLPSQGDASADAQADERRGGGGGAVEAQFLEAVEEAADSSSPPDLREAAVAALASSGDQQSLRLSLLCGLRVRPARFGTAPHQSYKVAHARTRAHTHQRMSKFTHKHARKHTRACTCTGRFLTYIHTQPARVFSVVLVTPDVAPHQGWGSTERTK